MDRYFQQITEKMIYLYEYPNIYISSRNHYCIGKGIEIILKNESLNENQEFWQKNTKCLLNGKEYQIKIKSIEKSTFHFKIIDINPETTLKSIQFKTENDIVWQYYFPIVIVFKSVHPWYKLNSSSIKCFSEKQIKDFPYGILVQNNNKKYIHFNRDVIAQKMN